MTNVTVQEALKAAIEALTSSNYSKGTVALEACKSAFAEIEKCEPVAWKARFVADEIDTSPEWVLHFEAPEFRDDVEAIPLCICGTSPQPIEKCESVAKQTPYSNCQFQICDLPGQCRGEGKCHHPAHPSPQPRDCEDWQYFDKAYRKAAETSDATDWMNAALLAQQVRRKQLNTKG